MIRKKVKESILNQKQKEILKQREPTYKLIGKAQHLEKHTQKEFVKTGINGFDELFEKGIPKGASTLLCGGPGSGKTIFGLQTLTYAAQNGEKCIYMTFEENEAKLRQHMEDFGWDWKKIEEEEIEEDKENDKDDEKKSSKDDKLDSDDEKEEENKSGKDNKSDSDDKKDLE